MPESPSAALTLGNSLDDLSIVRAVLSATADLYGLQALERDDLQTAVLEACKNVVWHAYEGVRGPLEVELIPGEGWLEVVVRDHGIGIRPHLGERTLPHTGIGMPIAHLLTRRITYTNVPDGGTEVRMEFTLPGVVPGAAGLEPAYLEMIQADGLSERFSLVLAAGPLIGSVLPAVLIALAPRAALGAEGASALGRLGQRLAAACEAGEGEGLALEIDLLEGGLDLLVRRPGDVLGAALADEARPGLENGPFVLAPPPDAGSPEARLLRLRLA